MKKIWYNGDIYDPSDGKEYSWIASEDGLIVESGGEQESPKLSGYDEAIDLRGDFMMPAFIDSHSHFISTAFSTLQLNLEECNSVREIAEKCRAFIKVNDLKPGEWVTAIGYDHNKLSEGRHPRRFDLDEYTVDNPVVLHHQSGHMGCFNTAALEVLELSAQSPCPEGGTMEASEGELTGYMEENAFILNIKNVPLPGLAEIKSAVQNAIELYRSYGITTVQEGMMVKQLSPMYQLIESIGDPGLDIVYYAGIEDLDYYMKDYSNGSREYRNHVRFGGLKLFLDGSPQGRTAWMRKPYVEAEGYERDYTGYGTMSDTDLMKALELAYDRGLQVLTHCNGDRAVEQLLDAAEELSSRGKSLARLRPVIIHAQMMGRDQLKRVGRLGFIPSYFAAHIYYWGDAHLRNFGSDRGSHISPLASTIKEGIAFTMHQDSPVIRPNMLETIWAACTRTTREGIQLAEDERISVKAAIRAVTTNAAYQYFEEDKKGALNAGMQANFVRLDRSPLKVEVNEIKSIAVVGCER